MILQDRFVVARPRVGSINDPEIGREAVRLMKEGYPVGAFMQTTSVIWIDADNRQGVESILRIKGAKRTGKPLSTILYADDLVGMINLNQIAPGLRPIFQDAGELASRLAMICLMRLPITQSAAQSLPEVVVSQTPDGIHWIQNWIPGKVGSDFPFVDQMLEMGIRVPSATSMNVSGQPEIVDQQEALDFCAAHGISLFVADPGANPVVKGSYPIISVGPDGVKLLREGHFPGYLFKYLLETEIDASRAARPNFPVFMTHCERCANRIEPHELHDEILEILEGV